MQVKTKFGRIIELPSDEEDARINAAIAADPDSPEWTEADFATAQAATQFFGADTFKSLVALKPPMSQ